MSYKVETTTKLFALSNGEEVTVCEERIIDALNSVFCNLESIVGVMEAQDDGDVNELYHFLRLLKLALDAADRDVRSLARALESGFGEMRVLAVQEQDLWKSGGSKWVSSIRVDESN